MMAGHKKWRDIVAERDRDPVRRARIDDIKHAMEDALTLGRLRERRGASQRDIAGALGTSQPNVSKIEGRDDIYLSTLREYVEALGGELRLTAVFPDETIELTSPASAREGAPATSAAMS
jgi:hypothetical protein